MPHSLRKHCLQTAITLRFQVLMLTNVREVFTASETVVSFYQTAWHISEDSHLHICYHENLKSHQTIVPCECFFMYYHLHN
jgi:hypothetical protein